MYSSVEAAELYVEHWAVDPSDLILDEDGRAYRAVAVKRRVRLISDGFADWQRVRARLAATAEGVEPSGSGTPLFDAVVQVFGIAE